MATMGDEIEGWPISGVEKSAVKCVEGWPHFRGGFQQEFMKERQYLTCVKTAGKVT